MRKLTASLLSALLAVSALAGEAQLSERDRAVHALNRLGFGPRPGDVDEVMKMGVDRWIELQLNPSRIDDSAVERRIGEFETLKLSPDAILRKFYQPILEARREKKGKEDA